MSTLLSLPISRGLSANAVTYPGMLLDAFATGTTTPQPVYTSAALDTPHPNPVVADSGGLLPPMFMDPALIYRFRARTSAGVPIAGMDYDPVTVPIDSGTLSGFIGNNLRRFSGSLADGTTSNNAAFDALVAAGGGLIPRQEQPYVLDERVYLLPGTRLVFEDGVQIEWMGGAASSSFDFIFIADSDCTIECVNSSGEFTISSAAADRFRWAVHLGGKDNVRVNGLMCRNMQHVYVDSATGVYGTTITSGVGMNVSTNFEAHGGGSVYDEPLTGSQSTAALYLGYVIGFDVRDARYENGVSGIQWWGGDADPAANGARANERKCRDGFISGVKVQTMIGAGVWGSMGQKIEIENCQIDDCADVGADSEGSYEITWRATSPTNCVNGPFALFDHCRNISLIDCIATVSTAIPLLRIYGGVGTYTDGLYIQGGTFKNDGTGFGILDSQFGFLRNLRIAGGAEFIDVTMDFIYNTTQNLFLEDYTLRYTKAAGAAFTGIRVGAAVDVGNRPATVRVSGVVTSDVNQPSGAIAVQVEQNDASPTPIAQIHGLSVMGGFTTDLVLAGTSGLFDLANNRITTLNNTSTGTTVIYSGNMKLDGSAVTQPFAALPLSNGWVNFGGSAATAGYRREGNRVELKGIIKSGTITDATTVGTLPVGYRPAEAKTFPLLYTDGVPKQGQLIVDTNGTLVIYGVSANTALTLSQSWSLG